MDHKSPFSLPFSFSLCLSHPHAQTNPVYSVAVLRHQVSLTWSRKLWLWCFIHCLLDKQCAHCRKTKTWRGAEQPCTNNLRPCLYPALSHVALLQDGHMPHSLAALRYLNDSRYIVCISSLLRKTWLDDTNTQCININIDASLSQLRVSVKSFTAIVFRAALVLLSMDLLTMFCDEEITIS